MNGLLHLDKKRNKQPTMTSPKGSRTDPRREIIEYLRAHPEAADTVNGILDGWIPNQRNENEKNELLRALEDLVRQGLIEEYVQANGSRHYRLPDRKDS
jgi:Fe2+ or Zn2+ uptake regulation protein